MNMKIVAAVLAGVAWAGVGFAEDVAKDAGKGAVEGVQAGGEVKAPDKKDLRPVTDTIVSPDASNTVDSEDLVKRLTGEDKESGGGADPMKKFKEIVDRMGDASTRLKNVDAGDVTQEVERRIVMDLDVLIDMAKKSQSSGKGKGDKSKDKAQQAQMGQGQQPGKPKPNGGNQAAQNSEARDGTATANPGADLHEKGAEGWGNLQERDRALITQGQQQTFLPSYRAMIERYYEELARLNRTSGR